MTDLQLSKSDDAAVYPKPLKIIVLDADGVLNRHEFNHVAQSCNIVPECVEHLNAILAATGAKVILSSAWRYMIHGYALTTVGFQYMLMTHGVSADFEIVGVTCKDEAMPVRGQQIWQALRDLRGSHITDVDIYSYVVIDDMDDGISAAGHPFVQTVAAFGLTAELADKAISILNGPRMVLKK